MQVCVCACTRRAAANSGYCQQSNSQPSNRQPSNSQPSNRQWQQRPSQVYVVRPTLRALRCAPYVVRPYLPHGIAVPRPHSGGLVQTHCI